MVNKVTLIGRLGESPELRETENGKAVTNFSMVTTETYKDDKSESGFSETNEWHKVVTWGYNAEKASNYDKGTLVYVEGKLTTRKWEDKEGNTRYTTEVKAESIKMLRKVGEPAQSSATA